ncbi:diacylglycerol/lipid kinase family protein [Autumnicola musiva]|uniref:Diacylglycerol kinase family protein n=1 Tax=Autumnicola musiva TaxID=3075589 RepID=A0ABU3D6U9_9FLAO|nr:diacylglycerol kinase family protein [Zunongwangia sp. F117]MDT0677262.1 diacylglycerol kinase family protein [Zunongwangia sp. F117]
MKTIQIVHNPTAGDGSHDKEELIKIVEDSGYKADYISTNYVFWKKHFKPQDAAAILLAGGDGTVRKLAKNLIAIKDLPKPLPIHLIPLGTANNISKVLRVPQNKEQHKINLERKFTTFSYGKIKSTGKKDFFLESFGFGIFPKLIAEMKKLETPDNPKEELQKTLEVLLEIVKGYKAKNAKIKTGGITIKGSFLLVELMNIKLIGPNFKLAPAAHPGDDHFELVLIPEEKRKALEVYLSKLITNQATDEDLNKLVTVLPVQKVKMKWSGSQAHVDDVLISNFFGKKFKIKLAADHLQFFTDIPEDSSEEKE